MPPLILPKIEQQKRNEKTPHMKHTRHQNHRPTTAVNTKGAVIPGYTGMKNKIFGNLVQKYSMLVKNWGHGK